MPHVLRTALILLLCLAPPAHAVDGVIEINQARALAGGITSGDTAGFPVTLSEGGSYRLTSNLVVDANTTGISITGDRVTLDMNGFAVQGPNTCTLTTPFPPEVTCTASGSGIGIQGGAVIGTFIGNGRVNGVGSHGIDLFDASASGVSLENVAVGQVGGDCIRGPVATRIRNAFIGACNGDGMDLDTSARVTGARIQVANGWAITAAAPVEVNDALITSTGLGGIQTTGSGGARVENSSIAFTGGVAISGGDGSVVENSSVNLNVGAGLVCGNLCNVRNVRSLSNTGAGITTGTDSRVTDVHINANTTGAVTTGSNSVVTNSRITTTSGTALVLGTGSAYGNNFLSGSTSVSGTSLTEISGNVCNGSATCP